MSSDYLPIAPDDARFMGVNAVISKTIDDYDLCELVKYCLEDKVYESKVFWYLIWEQVLIAFSPPFKKKKTCFQKSILSIELY